MALIDYQTANNTQGILKDTLTSSNVASFELDSKGELFPPTGPGIIKIEELDSSGKATKREYLTYQTRTGNLFFTLSRASEPCPLSDDSTTQQQSPQTFTQGAVVTLVNSAEITENLKTELERLETDKLDISTYNQEKTIFAVASNQGDDDYKVTVDSSQYPAYRTSLFAVQVDVKNSGPATVEVNTLGVLELKKAVDGQWVSLEDGDIPTDDSIIYFTPNVALGIAQFSIDPGQVAVPPSQNTETTVTLGETVAINDALYIDNATGKAFKTQANDTGKLNFIGFAKTAGILDDTIQVITSGVKDGFSGLTVGSEYFLSNTSGQIVTNVDSFTIKIGSAISATQIAIQNQNISSSIILQQSNNIRFQDSILKTISNPSPPIKLKEAQIHKGGTVKVTVQQSGGSFGTLIYINGVEVNPIQTGSQTYDYIANVSSGDLIQVYGYQFGSNGFITSFRLSYDEELLLGPLSILV